MIEYPFPENRVQLGSWPIVLHVVLLAMAIASVIVAFWRRRKPASLWDLPAWIAAVVIAGELVKFGQSDKFERPGLRVSLLIILLVAIGGILELLKRKFGVRAAIGVGLVALCGGVIQMMPQLDGGGREASRVSQCRNRLINIGFALHNYHDDYHTFPATAGDLGAPPRSWRVAILPYADHAPMYKAYHLSEPWDSVHNQQFQNQMPDVYQCPSNPRAGEHKYTDYFVPTGKGTMGEDSHTSLSLRDVRDGTSNTILVVEACGTRIIWTDPQDVKVTAQSVGINLPGPQKGLSRSVISTYHHQAVPVLFGDCSCRRLSLDTDKRLLQQLLIRNDGQPVAPW